MSAVRDSLEDYLRIRRSLGYKLESQAYLLGSFVSYLERAQAPTVTTELAVAWATEPANAAPAWWANRLSAVRGFATYLRSVDPTAQVPPRGLLPLERTSGRATPFLYSDQELAALIRVAGQLANPLRALTHQTLICLLAVTGVRIGEAIKADRGDLDLETGVLLIRDGKFGKSREIPLHPTTVQAMRIYLRRRARLHRRPGSPALFISTAGTRLIYKNVHLTFGRLVREAGLRPRSASCRPRLHDLRHSFAVRTLLDWYRADVEVQGKLPLLSTYLGHVKPSNTYWYLSGAPELLGLAGERLERHLGAAS
jgi:integrase/recombinase XerD